MAINVKNSVQLILLAAGISVVVLGIIFFAAGFMAEKHLEDVDNFGALVEASDIVDRKSQIWAGLPVLITGALLIITAAKPNVVWLNIVSSAFMFLSMILLLAVVIVEGPESSWFRLSHKSLCTEPINIFGEKREGCKEFEAATSWLNALVLLSDIILFLFLLALFATFTNIILVVVLKEQQPGYTYRRNVEMDYGNQAYRRNMEFRLESPSATAYQLSGGSLEISTGYPSYSKNEDTSFGNQSHNGNAQNGYGNQIHRGNIEVNLGYQLNNSNGPNNPGSQSQPMQAGEYPVHSHLYEN